MPSNHTQRDDAEILRLYAEGVTIGELAEREGITRSAMWAYIRRRTETRKLGPNPEDVGEMVRLYESGVELEDIADKWGCTYKTAWARLHKHTTMRPSRGKRVTPSIAIPHEDPTLLRIPLLHGLETIIEAADWPLVSGYRWVAAERPKQPGEYNVIGHVPESGAQGRNVMLHRLIMGVGPRQIVDHINHDSLDNRRSNLRLATNQQNSFNSRLSKRNTSGYKGVAWKARDQKWRARIRNGIKEIHIGTFDTAEEAAHAYDRAARELHGEFAAVNFPREGEQQA